jgi:curved DNA-binding protein CbpA
MPEQPRHDPYAVLGVPREATPLQVARAHRRLAKRYHPDLHPGEDVSDRMRRINEAWHLLSNPARRAVYDLDHPASSSGPRGHWVTPSRPAPVEEATTTRTWASWRATADETRAAPRTRRAPGEIPIPATRRPPRMEPAERTFRDSGLAAILVAVLILLLLVAAVVAGRIA